MKSQRLVGWACALAALAAIDGCDCSPPPPPPPPPPPAVIDLARCTLTVAPTTGVVADGTDQSAATVVVKDGDGGVLSGVPVQLAATGSGNLLSPTTNTDSTGTAHLSVRSTVAETKTISATLNPSGSTPLQIGATPQVTFVAGPPGVASTLTATPLAALDDGVSPIVATLTLKDSNDNLITSGANVTFSLTGSGNSVAPLSGTTNGSGVLQTTLTSTQPGLKTLTANIGGFTRTVDVVFLAGPPDQNQSSIAVAPAQVEADNFAVATVTVLVHDTTGGVAPGQSVALTVGGSGNTVTPLSGTTDINGRFQATIKSTQAEVKSISALVAGSFSLNTTATFVTGLPSQVRSSISPVPTTFAAGNPGSAITVSVRDSTGNPVAGQAVSMTASAGVTTFAPASGFTDGSGNFATQLTSHTAGPVTATAHLGALFDLTTNTLTVTPGPAAKPPSALGATKSQAVADGVDTITFTATVTDVYGNPLVGQSVAWSVTGTGGNTLTPVTTTTSASGTATATLKSTVIGSKTVHAVVASLDLTNAVSFGFGNPSQANSTLTLNPTPLPAGQSGTITVTVKDASGNLIQFQNVSVVVGGSGNTLTPASGQTDANGQFVATLSSPIAETKHITATVGSFNLQTDWTIAPGAPSGATSTLVAIPGSATANGSQSVTLTLTLQDAYANVISGQTVSWASSGTGNTLTQGALTTNTSGVATATLKSTKAETKTVTATAGSYTPQVTVDFVPGLANQAHSSFIAAPATRTVGGPTVDLTAIARDAFDNLVDAVPVSFSATGSGNDLSPASGSTNDAGVYSATLWSTVAEAKQLFADISTFTLDAGAVFTPGPAYQSNCSFFASPSSVVADAGSTLTVIALDEWFNPVPDQGVTFTSSGSNNAFFPASVTTDDGGMTASVFKSITAEAKTLTADFGAFALPAFVSVVHGPASAATSTLVVTPSSVPAGEGDTASVVVTLKDVYGNVVPGAVVSLSGTGTGNTFVPATPQPTNGSGVLAGTVRSSVVQLENVQATSGTVVLQQPITFTVAGPKMVSVSPPGGTLGGCVTLNYAVRQAQAIPVNMTVEYSTVGPGGPFQRATECGSTVTDGIYSLPASDAGTAHTFQWASTTDLPQQSLINTLALRLTPSSRGAPAGTAQVSSGLAFRNQVAFANPVSLVDGGTPMSLASADFDRDGRPDLVVSDATGNVVIYYRATGVATYAKTAVSPVGVQPEDVVTGDFSRDGRPDFAVVNYGPVTGSVDIYFNNGLGGFGSRQTLALPVHATALAAGDFNLDGALDLAVGCVADGVSDLLIYLNDGIGNFSGGWNYALIPGANVLSIHTADFNRDGLIDLALGTAAGALVVNGLGGPFFSPPNMLHATGTISLIPGDFDGDGKQDVVTSAGLFVKGNGDGTFAGPTPAGFSATPRPLTSAYDFNSDGKLDVASVVSGPGGVVVYAGAGNGSFSLAASTATTNTPAGIVAVDLDFDGRMDVAAVGGSGAGSGAIYSLLNAQNRRCDAQLNTAFQFATTPSAQFLTSGHLNADGNLDITSIGSGSIVNRLGNGNGTFRPAVACPNCTYGVTPLVVRVANLDADAFGDVVMAHISGVLVWQGNGTGVLAVPTAPVSLAPGGVTTMEIGDFNSDGKIDLAVGRGDFNGISVYFGNGNRTFSGSVDLATSGAASSLATGDVNGDGIQDIVMVGPADNEVFLSTGVGTFIPAGTIDLGVNASPSQVLLADMNGDAKLDLVLASNLQQSVSVALGNGNGTFQLPTSQGVTRGVWLGGSGAAVGDFTGDGLMDVVVSNPMFYSSITVLPGNGAGGLGAEQLVNSGANPADLIAGDFTGDGRPDVAVTASNYGQVILHPSSAQGLRQPWSSAPGVNLGPSALADFNRDGKLDMIAMPMQPGDNNRSYFMAGNGDGTFQPEVGIDGHPPCNPSAPAVADFNRDGKMDFAVFACNELLAYTGNGDGTFSLWSEYVTGNSLDYIAAYGIVAADFNRDGKPDIAISYNLTSYVAGYFQGNGDGSFQPGVVVQVSPTGNLADFALGAADMDRDGRPDLVVGGPNALVVVQGNGNGTFITPLAGSIFATGASSPTQMKIVDINHDGKLDVAQADMNGSRAIVTMGAGTNLFTSNSAPTMPYATDVAIVDLTDDGRYDLVTPNGGDYRFDSMAMRPGSGAGTFPLGTEVPTWLGGSAAYGLNVADVNRDGKPDLCTSNYAAGDVTTIHGR